MDFCKAKNAFFGHIFYFSSRVFLNLLKNRKRRGLRDTTNLAVLVVFWGEKFAFFGQNAFLAMRLLGAIRFYPITYKHPIIQAHVLITDSGRMRLDAVQKSKDMSPIFFSFMQIFFFFQRFSTRNHY